jgi:hypothetical protein
MEQVHRLVAICFIPNPNNLAQVNHIDGNKDNNHVNNLEWMSNEENYLHSWRTGLRVKKYNPNRNIVLTEEQVLEIVQLFKAKSCKDIAKIYNVKSGIISEIKSGRAWTNVTNMKVKLTKSIEKFPLTVRFEMYNKVQSYTSPTKAICDKYNISVSTLNNLCKWCEQNQDLNGQ